MGCGCQFPLVLQFRSSVADARALGNIFSLMRIKQFVGKVDVGADRSKVMKRTMHFFNSLIKSAVTVSPGLCLKSRRISHSCRLIDLRVIYPSHEH